MKMKRMISLVQCVVMGALAFDLMVILHRVALGTEVLEMYGFIVPTFLGGAAGALVRYYFLRGEEKTNNDAIPERQPAPASVAGEVPDDASAPVQGIVAATVEQADEALVQKVAAAPVEEGAEVPVREIALDSVEQDTDFEEPAEAPIAAVADGAVGTGEDLEAQPTEPAVDAEREPLQPDEPRLVAQAEQDAVEQLAEEQRTAVQELTPRVETQVVELTEGDAALQKEKEFLTGFMDHASTFCAALDDLGKIVMVNRSMAQSLGYTVAEVTGMDFMANFVPEGLRREGLADLFNFSSTGDAHPSIESFVLAKDGSEVPVEWHATAVFDATDALASWFLVGIDITERKQVENARQDADLHNRARYEEARRDVEHYRSALDASPDAMIIYDMAGKATFANAAFTAIFGWTAEELQEKQAQFVPESQRDLEEPIIAGLMESGAPCKDLETKRGCKDGRPVVTRLTASLFRDQNGDPTGILFVLRDVTAEAKVEREPEKRISGPEKRQVSAKEIVKAIRSGATDSQLMEKYKLTAKGLQSLFQKLLQAKVLKPSEIYGRLTAYDETVAIEMSHVPPTEATEPPPKTIKSSRISADIRAGATKEQLMEKYGLTAVGLDNIFKKLVAAGVMTADEVNGGSPSDAGELEDVTARRTLPRNYMVVSIPIYEANDLLSEGTIIDINENGMKIQGIKAAEGEAKSLLVQGDEFHDVYPFVFDAVCRWTKTDETTGVTAAGFEIAAISDASLDELRKLISALSISS